MHFSVHMIVSGLKTAHTLCDWNRGLAVTRRFARAHLTTHADAVHALQRGFSRLALVFAPRKYFLFISFIG